jgi:predicted O-methyltransferase YrrM
MQTNEQKEYNKKIPGWLGDFDLVAISKLASNTPKNAIIAEVGSMHGKSAYCIATSAPTASLYCYDLWREDLVRSSDEIDRSNSIDEFKKHVGMCKNIIPTRIKSADDINHENLSIDMFFLDAAHTNPSDWEWIEFWLPKIKSGGVICGHDYYQPGKHTKVHYPDINENIEKLEKILDQKVTTYVASCIWSFKL